ncbi:MAG: hypothetical protein NC418_04570 [Muribaculaceae bacterium]|nr:hypothetical protein [Muribaculaceae bacterium]MCM1225110.1 hypothetical protein [Lachnospiraceae bacterium]
MEIKNENLIAAYNAADESGKTMLRAMFPDMEWNAQTKDNRPITERVKTFEDACDILGACPGELEQQWEEAGLTMPDEIAYQKLRLIAAALNKGWTPKFTEDEWRYYPWFYLWTDEELADKSEEWKRERCLQSTGGYETQYSGFAFAYSAYAPSRTFADFGSRLCFKSDTLADYAGKQFIKLWMDFYLIRK